MELKAGYKQSEVGVIPEDWEVKSVHEIGQIRTGPFGTLLSLASTPPMMGFPSSQLVKYKWAIFG
jgi:type I restriction enzyme S subunit